MTSRANIPHFKEIVDRLKELADQVKKGIVEAQEAYDRSPQKKEI